MPAPTIAIDSREQQPYSFDMPAQVVTLPVGDYSCVGLERHITIERKELGDFLQCVGRERARFIRELTHMRAYPYRLLLIEADAATLNRGQWRSRLVPAHALGAISSWIGKYQIPLWLDPNRESAAQFVQRFILNACRNIVSDYRAARALVEVAEPAEVTR